MRKFICTLAILLLASCASILPSSSGKYTPPEPNGIAKRIWMPNGKKDLFAVIIAGDAELRHQGNVSVAYQTLIELGHTRNNIIVLAEGNKDTPWFPWTDAPTKASVRMAFAKLAFAMEPHDTLAVYLTGHGDKSFIDAIDAKGEAKTYGFSTFKLNPAENLTRNDFEEMLGHIHPRFGLLVMDHCYWGIFKKLPCVWSQYAATQNGVLSNNSTFGRTFWREFVKPGVYSTIAFERAVAASPKDHPTTKVCSDTIPETVPIPPLLLPRGGI